VVDRGDVSSLFLFALKVLVKTEHEGFAVFEGVGGGTPGLCHLLWWL
jgi:hypothetical protein